MKIGLAGLSAASLTILTVASLGSFPVPDAKAQWGMVPPQIIIQTQPSRRSSGGNRSQRRSSPQKATPRAAVPAEARWYTTNLGSIQKATNNQGIWVSFDDAGELVIELDCRQPIFGVDGGTEVQVSFLVSGGSNSMAMGELKTDRTQVVVSGIQAVQIAQALKNGSRVEVTFPSNTLSARLSGSRDAISLVELAASQWKLTHQSAKVAAREVKEEVAREYNERIGELESQIDILTKVLDTQKSKLQITINEEEKVIVIDSIAAIESRIVALKKEVDEKEEDVEYYLINIRPQDRDLYNTARKASEIAPQAPYYIPGTDETGEFWVEPTVTNEGVLQFNFRMVDPSSPNETTRSLIPMSLKDLEKVQAALQKLSEMSKTAHKNKIRKKYSKRVICFPLEECPDERSKGIMGKSSTEVVFQIYEDGSTAGTVLQNKGPYQEGFNISIDTARYFQAYLDYVIKEAKVEYESGTRTEEDLDKLFE